MINYMCMSKGQFAELKSLDTVIVGNISRQLRCPYISVTSVVLCTSNNFVLYIVLSFEV